MKPACFIDSEEITACICVHLSIKSDKYFAVIPKQIEINTITIQSLYIKE